MIDLSLNIVLLYVSRPLGASVGVMSWFSTIEASVIIDCIWCLWCAILLWSIGDIILHRNILGLLLVLDWCLILLLLLLYMLWLLVMVVQTGLTLIALLWVSRPLGASVGVMSRLSTIEAFIIINCIWRFWCAIPLWSIGGIVPHRYIVGLL